MATSATVLSTSQPFGSRTYRALLVGLVFVVLLLLALITLPPLTSSRADTLRTHLDTDVQVFADTLTAVENSVQESLRAREGLLAGGDLTNAGYTYHQTVVGLLDCGPALDTCMAQVNAALRKHLDPSKISVVKAGDFSKK